LWVREDRQASIQPAVISHGNNRPRNGFSGFQDRFDWAGSFDLTAWLCAAESINYLGGLLPGGWPELRRRNRDLVLRGRRLLCERLGVAPPCPEKLLGAMATIPLPARFSNAPPAGKIDDEQLWLYDRFAIEVPFVRFGEPPRRYFRISAQVYNSVEEYQFLANALQAWPSSPL
jgi:isopenicillin-N epimerase